jgi:hypothetical protein
LTIEDCSKEGEEGKGERTKQINFKLKFLTRTGRFPKLGGRKEGDEVKE